MTATIAKMVMMNIDAEKSTIGKNGFRAEGGFFGDGVSLEEAVSIMPGKKLNVEWKSRGIRLEQTATDIVSVFLDDPNEL
jgi:hypothetical protein